jgi:hypothetical protein
VDATALTNSCNVQGTKFVTGAAVDTTTAKITVTGNEANLSALTAATHNLTLQPFISGRAAAMSTDGGGTIQGWRCGDATTDLTTIPQKYLPSSCRGVYP